MSGTLLEQTPKFVIEESSFSIELFSITLVLLELLFLKFCKIFHLLMSVLLDMLLLFKLFEKA